MKSVAILYSNSPNPIIVERYKSLEKIVGVSPYVLHFQRSDSSIDLTNTGLATGVCCEPIILKNGFFSRLRASFSMFLNLLRRQPDLYYAVYLDMLVVALAAKLLRGGRIVYEIQDVNQAGFLWRILENVLCFFSVQIFLTAPKFEEISLIWQGNKQKALFVSNGPSRELVEQYYQRKHSKTKTISIGMFGMIREKKQLEDLQRLLEKTRANILVAGTCLYEPRLQELVQSGDNRLVFVGPYNTSTLYSELYPLVDIVWAVYPNTLNYRNHIARRYMEAMALGKGVIVADHAAGMIEFSLPEDPVLSLREDWGSNFESELQNLVERSALPRNTDRFYLEHYFGNFESAVRGYWENRDT